MKARSMVSDISCRLCSPVRLRLAVKAYCSSWMRYSYSKYSALRIAFLASFGVLMILGVYVYGAY